MKRLERLGVLLRTVSHLTPGQVGWRAVHVARMKAYQRFKGWPAARLAVESSAAAALAQPFVLQTTLPEHGARMVALWKQGLVEYHGVQGTAADWRAEEQSRLWKYERHYHSEVMALAWAEAQTRDGSCRKLILELLESWERDCPPLAGPSWEPYPMARRILHWSVALAACPTLSPTIAGRLAPHVRHLAKHLEKHLLGNHLLCDLFAIAAGTSVINSDGLADLWEMAASELRRHLPLQLLPDGGYAERTPQYHAIVLRDLLWATALSQARGRDLGLRKEATQMLTWAESVARPDGTFPWINDAAPDTTPTIESLRALAKQANIDSTFVPSHPLSKLPVVLKETGWVICRDGVNELLFDFGVVGPKDQPGHGHADALAFELVWQGVPLVSDTGVTTYERGAARSYERSAQAHATVAVNDEGADEVWASFRVGGRSTPELIDIEHDESGTIITAQCLSFRGWTHTRRLVFRPGHSLLVEDTVRGAPEGARVVSYVPIAPGWSARGAGRFVQLIGQSKSIGLEAVEGGPPELCLGWQSRGFGRPEARDVIAIRLVGGKAAYRLAATS